MAVIPLPSPVKPNPSVVVALIETGTPRISGKCVLDFDASRSDFRSVSHNLNRRRSGC